jgi:zinc transport system substrate-binding protein
MNPVLAFASSLAIIGVACGSAQGNSQGGRPSVVAAFYPLFEASSRVGGDRVAVRNLTPVGTEPHDLELSTDDLDAILDADLVVYLGRGFQPAIEDAVGQRDGSPSVDVLAGLGQDVDQDDPHVWLDPQLMGRIVELVAESMASIDPDGAAVYRANADEYRSELDQLDQAFRTGLERCERRVVVTAHAAFGYLAARYDLRQEAISGLSPEAEPDPGRLAELADLVREEGVTTIFTEELVSPRVAETLAHEAGVTTAVLNPVEGLTETQLHTGETYDSVMRSNLATLMDALGCG